MKVGHHLLWTHGHCHCQSGWSNLRSGEQLIKGKFSNTAMLAVRIDFVGSSARYADLNG